MQAALDRSALQSYANGHIHVGELLVDAAGEGAFMAIPAAALMEAYAEALRDEHAAALLSLLVTLPGITVLDLDGPTAPLAAHEVAPAKGDLPRSHTVWAAKEHDAWYLTTEPAEVTDLLPPDQVHVPPSKDA